MLDVPASTVDLLIDDARRLPQIRHYEPRVVPRRLVSEPDDLSLDHDAARPLPRAGSKAGVGVDLRGLAARRALRLRHHQGGLGLPLQHRVRGHGHHVVEPQFSLEDVNDLRGREAAVEPDQKPRPGKGLA